MKLNTIFTFIFLLSNVFMLNSVHAQESLYGAYIESIACQPPSPVENFQNEKVIAEVDESFLMQLAWPCAGGILMGVWDSTGELVKGAVDCTLSPIECSQSAQQAFDNAYQFFADITKNVSNAFSAISGLSPTEKAEIICSIIGGIGTDVIIAIFSAGATSAKLSMTITKITQKLTKLAKIKDLLKNIRLSKLVNLSQKLVDKVEDIVTSGYGDEVLDIVKKACPL